MCVPALQGRDLAISVTREVFEQATAPLLQPAVATPAGAGPASMCGLGRKASFLHAHHLLLGMPGSCNEVHNRIMLAG